MGIESSCDETAAAVVSADGRIHSNVVRSQVATHGVYGGVVPELAARDHVGSLTVVVQEALAASATELRDIDGIAVTNRPGLVGALLVGLQAAKGIAWAAEKPLVGVDHLVGHLLSVFLRDSSGPHLPPPEFPYVALLVSGGNTGLYRCEGANSCVELGGTRDDAVGEVYDKVSKLLGLGYPGGPPIDRLARLGESGRFNLPQPMSRASSLEFSFSGLKSAVARQLAAQPPEEREIPDWCATFQSIVTSTLVAKTISAAERERVDTVAVVGGVAANRELRERMAKATKARALRLCIPSVATCTDNAAMIAYVGAKWLAAGHHDDFSVGVSASSSIPRVTRKGRGSREVT
ncbi:MAG: tRNA (adenosine(37)-N6)-threonylcarbamoyltransferase complex transferase subunit TsaD [Myxococcota bacterium]